MNTSIFHIPSELTEIQYHPGKNSGIKLFLKRDDLIHPEISGNKWRKLKYNFEYFFTNSYKEIYSAGGYYSNHLAALAYACNYFKIPFIAFIRGEEPAKWNQTLNRCKQLGTHFIFLSRADFDNHILDEYKKVKTNKSYFIPMGGENELGIKGCKEIIHEISIPYNYIALPVGTGTTITGVNEACMHKNILGFLALEDKTLYEKFNSEKNYIELISNYTNGFAKSSLELENFILKFYEEEDIILEPVYTGKMMFGIYDLIKQGYFISNSIIIAIHTGGIQGIYGYPDLHKRLFTR